MIATGATTGLSGATDYRRQTTVNSKSDLRWRTKDQLEKRDAAIAARGKAWSEHTVVTFHGSMSYFSKRYGIRSRVIEPLAGKEPTPAYIAEVLARTAPARARSARRSWITVSAGDLKIGDEDVAAGHHKAATRCDLGRADRRARILLLAQTAVVVMVSAKDGRASS